MTRNHQNEKERTEKRVLNWRLFYQRLLKIDTGWSSTPNESTRQTNLNRHISKASLSGKCIKMCKLMLKDDVKAGPLDLSFWSFLTFLHHGIEKVERHRLWQFYKKIQRKSWSNVPPKLLACVRFLHKVVHKIGCLRKYNRAREIEFNFLPFWLSLWNLAHLFIVLTAAKFCLRFFNFCLGT